MAAKDMPHWQVGFEQAARKTPLMAMDYMFAKTAHGSGGNPQLSGVTQGLYATCACVVDTDSGMVRNIPLPGKGLHPYCTAVLEKFITGMYHQRVRLRG